MGESGERWRLGREGNGSGVGRWSRETDRTRSLLLANIETKMYE
jgi:hypothetical protein